MCKDKTKECGSCRKKRIRAILWTVAGALVAIGVAIGGYFIYNKAKSE